MSGQSVTVSQAIEFIKNESVLILDTRDAQSFAIKPIADAKNISPDNAQEILSSLEKDQPILVYCYHGIGSLSWVDMLSREGFKRVYNLQGGFSAWLQEDGESLLKAALANQ